MNEKHRVLAISLRAGWSMRERWGWNAWKRLLSTETKVSVLSRISRKRQSFRSDSSKWKGPLFLPLVSIPPSYIPVFNPRSAFAEFVLSPSTRRGKGRSYEESIMELFKFVSNIEISFMPGELIIEVYRRTRRRLRMPGIVRARNGRGGEKWTFCFSLDYCFLLPEPISIPPSSLSRLFILPRGNEDVFSASRRRFPFNFSRSREVPTPVGMGRESKEILPKKGTWFVKSYCLIWSVCRVLTANRCLSAESIVVFSRIGRKDAYIRCFFERNFVLSIFLLIMLIFEFILYDEILFLERFS